MTAAAFDLVVLGGGPAGTSGAFAAALFGKRVALVEPSDLLGGAGANTGTIPTKTLRESALLINGWRTRKLLGIDLHLRTGTTIEEFTRHAGHVMEAERRRLDARVRELGVHRVVGRGRFVDPHTVAVEGPGGTQTLLRGDVILVATGSSPVRPPEFPFDHPRVHDSDQLLTIKVLPRVLAVVGAGVIGAEYACTFAALGVKVHVVDGRDALLPFLDRDVAAAITGVMTRAGVQFHWKQTVTACRADGPDAVTLTLSSGETLPVSDVLVAAGRVSNTASLDLPAAGLTTAERGQLTADAHGRTAVPHIYAAGDVVGSPALAATSMEQARIAVCHAFAIGPKEAAPIVPTGIYTIPEAATIGQTEHALHEKGIATIVGRADYSANPRGRIIGDETGFLKLVFAQRDLKLLGVHAVGEQATELVHIGMVAMLADADAHLFSRACFNYPTLGDLYKYAAYDAIIRHRAGP